MGATAASQSGAADSPSLHRRPNVAANPSSGLRPLVSVPLFSALLVLLGGGQTGKRPMGRDSLHSLSLLDLQCLEEEGQGRRAALTSPGHAVWIWDPLTSPGRAVWMWDPLTSSGLAVWIWDPLTSPGLAVCTWDPTDLIWPCCMDVGSTDLTWPCCMDMGSTDLTWPCCMGSTDLTWPCCMDMGSH